jgi:hypothetical protein
MTLCMAASCQLGEEPRIVLCTDWQQQVEGVGGAENRNKLDWVKDGWPVVVSDTLCHAEELVGTYRKHLEGIELVEANVLDEMKIPAQTYKAALADDYIKQTLGIDYNYFLQYGKERLPEELFRDKLDEVSRIELGASLIIAGFAKCEKIGPYNSGLQPFLCVVEDTEDHKDVVRLENDFATIGSGTYVASAALFHREQHWERPLLYTIYSVFEAHRFSNKVPGVGYAMSIDVLEPGGIRSLSDAGYDYCESLFARFGPRPILKKHKDKFEMKDEFLDTFEIGGEASWE